MQSPSADAPLSASDERHISAIAAERSDAPGALLPILHAGQKQLGYVPAGAIALIAEALNLARAGVHGVVSFYHFARSWTKSSDLRRRPNVSASIASMSSAAFLDA